MLVTAVTTAVLSNPNPDETNLSGNSVSPARTSRSTRTDELVELLRSCANEVEREALRRDLIAANMPVARAIAGRYRARGIASEDLEQVAYLALVKATQRFDPGAGFAFLSFCVPTVHGEVRRHFRDHGWMVRPPRRVQELQQRVTKASVELMTQLGRQPAARELAEHLDEQIDHVLEAMDSRGAFTPSSLDRIVGEGDTTLGDLIGADQANLQSAEARLMLAPAVRRLAERDRQILSMRFFDGLTQREIAEVLGVTQMQVSRLLSRIFRDLRQALGPLDDRARPPLG